VRTAQRIGPATPIVTAPLSPVKGKTASPVRTGLLASRPQGKMPAVWLCSPSKSSWAVLHTIKRHGDKVETTVVLVLDVPRSWLRRSRKGLRYVLRDVPPDRIRRVFTFSELAGASTDAA
jgi:hypothetical protein